MTKYFFIGIKGTGMGALAQILSDQGNEVLGSDIQEYTYTQPPLEARNIEILPFDANNVDKNQDAIFIRGNAFQDDHVEIARALQLGVQLITYPKAVQDIIDEHVSIGVAGAHGKTSTTGLLAHAFSSISPTSYLIGDGTGKGVSQSKFFIFEADEYRRHFKDYKPDYAVITNIDFDHPDYYEDIDDVTSAFADFAKNVKKALFAYGEDQQIQKIKLDIPIYYYGFNDDDQVQAFDVKRTTTGSEFKVKFNGELIGTFKIPLFGEHGILNALAVIGIAYLEKMSLEQLQESFMTFKGVKRRFSEKQINDVILIDDYAHHPSEINATIDAAKQKYPNKKIVAIFQPHTFSRVIAYKDEFAASLSKADEVYLADIFGSARESSGNITSSDLGSLITSFVGMVHEDNMSNLLKYDDAVMLFMGAGDIEKYEFAYEKLLTQSQLNLQ